MALRRIRTQGDSALDSRQESRESRFAALDALRGVAVLMVVYDHLFAVAGERYAGQAFAPVPFVREHITGPLGIIQDFGWFGVCLFFLISGFVILHAARRESAGEFIVRRFFRIAPPLAVAVAAVAALDVAGGTGRPLGHYLLGASLLGYLTLPQIVVLGVGWTLLIEVIFYGLVALTIPLLRGRWVALGVAGISLVPVLTGLLAREFGDRFFLLAAAIAYLPVLLMGSAIYLGHQRLCPAVVALVLLGFNAAVFAWGVAHIHTSFAPLENSYLLSLVYALSVLLLAMTRPAPSPLCKVGEISYSLYLLHGTLGFAAIEWMVRGMGALPWVPWLATAAMLLVSLAMWRWVERPCIQLGRRWHNASKDSALRRLA